MQVKNIFAKQTSLWNYAPEVEQACQQKVLQGISAFPQQSQDFSATAISLFSWYNLFCVDQRENDKKCLGNNHMSLG